MCKRINRFIPVLFVSSIVLTILAGAVIAVTGVNIPLWGSYLISQAIVLLPALVYVAVHKINIIACMPYRKLRISDGLLSLLIGYTVYQDCFQQIMCRDLCRNWLHIHFGCSF